MNANNINLNQNSYRTFRSNPPKRPYSYIFLHYLGPFFVKLSGDKKKVWLLALTCLYTRAVNIQICRSADVADFLRGLQMHVTQYGIFEGCVSDLGSQIKAGSKILTEFLSDAETVKYCEHRGMKQVNFQQFAKGNSSLGSLIESQVKQIKRLIYKTIRNTVLDYFDFELVIAKTKNLINKRPIGFKDGLRASPMEDVPTAITPEMLILGYDTPSINVIPQLQPTSDDEDLSPNYGEENVNKHFQKLRLTKERLVKNYHSEFISTLLSQATDKKDRYGIVKHEKLKPGDLVLLEDKMLKRNNYPLGRIISVEENSLGEVTAAYIKRGDTGEKVYRHSTSLILLIASDLEPRNKDEVDKREVKRIVPRRKVRKSAQRCRERIATAVE